MEQKERFIFVDDEYEPELVHIFDTKTEQKYFYLILVCDLLNQQDKEIQQLKNDVANYKYSASRNSELAENFAKAKDALVLKHLKRDAEMTNQIIDLKTDLNRAQLAINGLKNRLVERQLTILKHKRAKYSIAIEELKKLKNRIEGKVENIDKRLDDLKIKIVCESTSRQLSTYEEIVEIIDQQIKSLKGEE